MDSIRHSLSKTKKKLKQRLTGRRRKPDGTGANPGGERVDSTSSLPRPDPHVVAGESHGQGNSTNADGEQVRLTDRPQPEEPESVSTCGGGNDQEGEVSQIHPPLHPDSESGMGSESSEVEWFSLSGSTASLSLHGGEPDGT